MPGAGREHTAMVTSVVGDSARLSRCTRIDHSKREHGCEGEGRRMAAP
jgi:hypothetical protein